MKVVKSKLSIALMGLVGASVVGAVSYAALNRPVTIPAKKLATKNSAPAPVINEKVVAPHQDDIDRYLNQVKEYMQTPPRDGVFGSERVPTLHGKDTGDIIAYDGIRSMEGQYYVRSAVMGIYPTVKVNGDGTVIKPAHGVVKQDSSLSGIRMSDIHLVTPNRGDNDKAYANWDKESVALRQVAAELMKSGPDQDTRKIDLNGKSAWVVSSAVHASVNSCYKCHNTIEKGKPIGYVTALVTSPSH